MSSAEGKGIRGPGREVKRQIEKEKRALNSPFRRKKKISAMTITLGRGRVIFGEGGGTDPRGRLAEGRSKKKTVGGKREIRIRVKRRERQMGKKLTYQHARQVTCLSTSWLGGGQPCDKRQKGREGRGDRTGLR